MSDGTIEGDGLGTVMRCWYVKIAPNKRMKICIPWGIRTTRVEMPDPPPDIVIEGVDPELTRELEALDVIHHLADRLGAESKNAIRSAVDAGVGRLKQRLPEHISLH